MKIQRNYIAGAILALAFTLVGYLCASWVLTQTPEVKIASHDATATARTETKLPVSIADVVNRIDEQRMLKHIEKLAGQIGVRKSGTAAEQEASQYVAETLRSWGYQVQVKPVDVEGRAAGTQNVIAAKPQQTGKAMLIGGHIDSKDPSPGANDNASGVAVMLELAYLIKDIDNATPCIFVAFGAEEMIDKNKEHHHYGARALANDKKFRATISNMTSLDMVGVGDTLYLETQGSDTGWRDKLAVLARQQGYSIKTGAGMQWSDHEAFEKYNLPCAYVHWERDTEYHKATDTPGRIKPSLLTKTATLMLRAIIPTNDN